MLEYPYGVVDVAINSILFRWVNVRNDGSLQGNRQRR